MPSSLRPILQHGLTTLLALAAPVTVLAGITPPAASSPPAQWVQVIVFRSLDRDAGRHERWGHTIPTGQSLAGVDLKRASRLPPGFHPARLGPTMRHVWSVLQASALYHPLLKEAWVQPAFPLGAAIPVALGLPREPQSPHEGLPGTVKRLEDANPSRHEAHLMFGKHRFAVMGTVQVTVMRHVYIEIHALLVKKNRERNQLSTRSRAARPVPPGRSRPHRFTLYPINQADQFHPGRVSYFDNPVYGILVYIKSAPESTSTTPLAAGG